jgi:predicted metal-dependent phosphoesterase TrpH
MFKGALHAHSTYSDGEFTLPELREIFIAQGCSFLCMTDHAEYFDEASVERYRRECESLSDEKFCLVPGLEYRCEREMHILGYTATKLTQSSDPQQVIRHIDSQSAISVIAHPKDDFFEWIESFQILPQAIETWNSKYDGRYAPRPGTFQLLQRLKKRAPQMRAFYGLDLHWKHQYRGLHVLLDCGSLHPEAIRSALAEGAYRAQKDDLQLPSDGVLSESLLDEFSRVQARSRSMWRFFKSGKQQLDRFGIRVPESLKAQLRRIF